MRKLILIFILHLIVQSLVAQDLDSLKTILPKQKGLEKAGTYHEIAWIYRDTNFSKAVFYGEEALKIAEALKSHNDICVYANTLGIFHLLRNRLEEAQGFFLKSLYSAEQLNDKKRIAQVYSNLGNIYHKQLNYNKSLEYHLQAYQMKKEIKDEKTYVSSLINIAGTYFELKEVDKAEEYFLLAEKEALKYNDKRSLGIVWGNLGIIHREKNNLDNAIQYYNKSLTIKKEQGSIDGISATELNLGSLYLKAGALDSAQKYLELSLEKALLIENYDRINLAYWNLADLYYQKGEYKPSHEYAVLAYRTKDSIYAINNSKALVELQTRYETEKKEKQIELLKKEAQYNDLEKEKNRKELELLNREKLLSDYEKNARVKEIDLLTQQNLYKEIESENKSKEIELLNKERTIKESELERQKMVRNLFVVGFISLLLIAFFIYSRYQIKQRSNKILELQNAEIIRQKDQIEKQKSVVEEQHKDITDSIRYAKRIQEAMLPDLDFIKTFFPDSFVFFKPKDVVSGDFYWAEVLNNGNFALSVADSTGHGVPGAIMSMLNMNSLKESAKEGLSDPGEILNRTREIIIQTLVNNSNPKGANDGMDCSLLVFNSTKTKLSFALANNPVWIINPSRTEWPSDVILFGDASNGKPIGVEFKPDKMPVGKHEKDNTPFHSWSIDLQKGDLIYIFTDGMPDQFGGPKGKKFMYKRLKELFLGIAQKSLEEQQEIVNRTFSDWKGNLEQVDDICIIGVRI